MKMADDINDDGSSFDPPSPMVLLSQSYAMTAYVYSDAASAIIIVARTAAG